MTDSEYILELEKALKELEGFATRNRDRAQVAFTNAKGITEKSVQEGRYHEAARIFLVVRNRVREALHVR